MTIKTHSQNAALFSEFHVETEMKDVEIFRVTPDRILAKGKRYGRFWLLRGLPPDKRTDVASLSELRVEFDLRYGRMQPDIPLTVGMEEIDSLGPCIVEEWREDSPIDVSLEEKCEDRKPNDRNRLRRLLYLTAFLIALGAGLAAGLHIRGLTARSETVKGSLEALREANRQSEERMFMLADSLGRVLHGSLISDEFAGRLEIKEEDGYGIIVKALYQTKIKEFEKELERYDREVIPDVIEDRHVFLDSVCALNRSMLYRAADIDLRGTFAQLPQDELIRLRSNLCDGYMFSYSDYSKVWMPKAWAAYQKKKQEKASQTKTEGNERNSGK